MSDKLKTVFYEQQNYFEKMMGIMLEWYHLLIGMQTTVLNIVLKVFVVPFFDCMLSSFRFIVHVFIFKIVFENKMSSIVKSSATLRIYS